MVDINVGMFIFVTPHCSRPYTSESKDYVNVNVRSLVRFGLGQVGSVWDESGQLGTSRVSLGQVRSAFK